MKVLALTEDGRLTYCTAPEGQRGKGRWQPCQPPKGGAIGAKFYRGN